MSTSTFRLALPLLLCLAAGSAAAAGRLCASPEVLLFGNQAVATTATRSSTIGNCGDAPFSFTNVSVHPATAPAFAIATSCATGATLGPGQSCTIDVTFAPVKAGQVSGGLWLRNTTGAPDEIVTFYGRGTDARTGTASLEFDPPSLTFPAQVVGTQSATQTVTLRNLGPGPLTPSALVVNGPTPYDFHSPHNCFLGVPIPPGGSCTIYFYFMPTSAGVRSARLNIDAPELADLALMSVSGLAVPSPPPVATIDVVEFYNPPLNHYFLTAVPEEAALIDAGGVGPNWSRTGQSFRGYPAGSSAGAAVCRFFGTPGIGPSAHFYTADPAECAIVKTNPHWTYEGIAFAAVLPAQGACAAGMDPVVRFFWPGAAVSQSRHRYVRDAAEMNRMRAAAWIEEGPVFCSPPQVQ